MSREPTVIYSAASTQQAYLLKGLLEDSGIAATVVNDAIQLAGGELPLGWASAARVVVDADDAPRAREIASEFDQHPASEAGPDSEEVLPVEAERASWPECPVCQEPRSARCTVCGESGTSFEFADSDQPRADGQTYLVCSICDDHFVPEWYRFCPRCGHDYGHGIEAGRTVMAREDTGPYWVVVAVLAAGLGLFGAYFAWLLRR